MAFLNEAELRQAIEGGLTTAITSTINAIHEKNEEEINTVVYGSYAPSWYGRTKNFLNAWSTEVGGTEGEMYYDESKVSTGSPDDGVHVSVAKSSFGDAGASMAAVMPEVIYQWGQGCIPRPTGRDAWKALDSFLTNTQMRSLFEAGLNASGLPWKRSTGAITVTKTK